MIRSRLRGAAPARFAPEGWASPEALVGVHRTCVARPSTAHAGSIPFSPEDKNREHSCSRCARHSWRVVLRSEDHVVSLLCPPRVCFSFSSLSRFRAVPFTAVFARHSKEGCVAEATRTAFGKQEGASGVVCQQCAPCRGDTCNRRLVPAAWYASSWRSSGRTREWLCYLLEGRAAANSVLTRFERKRRCGKFCFARAVCVFGLLAVSSTAPSHI